MFEDDGQDLPDPQRRSQNLRRSPRGSPSSSTSKGGVRDHDSFRGRRLITLVGPGELRLLARLRTQSRGDCETILFPCMRRCIAVSQGTREMSAISKNPYGQLLASEAVGCQYVANLLLDFGKISL